MLYMSIITKYLFLLFNFFFFCLTTSAQINKDAIDGIHWGWIDNGPPDMVCASDEIAPGVYRGQRGPKSCFDLAIAASKAGNDALALRWIITTQCHNSSVRNSLLSGGVETVKFLMNTYGGGYTNSPKQPTSQTAACTISIANRTDRDYEIYYIIFKTDRPPSIPCESLKDYGIFSKHSGYTILLPEGNDIWVRVKTTKSNGCTSSDVKFEFFGIGTFTANKVYIIN